MSGGIRRHFISSQYPRRTRKGNSPRAAVSPPMTLKMLRLRPHVPSANEGSQSPSSDASAAVVVTEVVEVVLAVVVVLDEEDSHQSHLGSQYPQRPLPPTCVLFSWVCVEHHSLPSGSVAVVQVLRREGLVKLPVQLISVPNKFDRKICEK